MHLLASGVDEIFTKGLPAIFKIRIEPEPAHRGGGVRVVIVLLSDRRSAVERWAKRLGSTVVEGEPSRAFEGARLTRRVETTAKLGDLKVNVWTSVEVGDPSPGTGVAL